MEKKKLALTILQWTLIVIGLGCSLTSLFWKIHKKEVYKKELAEATAQAVEYVRDKYGFEPESVDMSKDNTFAIENREPSKESIVMMKANGRDFYVKSVVTENGIKHADNYQWNEIEAAIVSEIEKLVPDGKAIDVYAYNLFPNENFLILKNVFSEYYDGSNLEELMENSGGSVEMVFPNVDIEKSGLCEKLRSWGLTYKLTVFDTDERAQEFAEKLRHLNENEDYISESRFGKYAPPYRAYAPYIIKSFSYYSGENGGAKTIGYELQDFDDFKYGYFPTHIDDYRGSKSVGISYGKSGEIARWFGHYGENNAVGKPLSKEYMLENGYGDVVIYYPLEKFKDMNINKVGLAWFIKDSYVTNNRDIAHAEVCGDYAVFSVHCPDDNMSFVLVDMNGQENYTPEYKRDKS